MEQVLNKKIKLFKKLDLDICKNCNNEVLSKDKLPSCVKPGQGITKNKHGNYAIMSLESYYNQKFLGIYNGQDIVYTGMTSIKSNAETKKTSKKSKK